MCEAHPLFFFLKSYLPFYMNEGIIRLNMNNQVRAVYTLLICMRMRLESGEQLRYLHVRKHK